MGDITLSDIAGLFERMAAMEARQRLDTKCLTLDEVSAELEVDRRTVTEWLRSGQLKGWRISENGHAGQWRILRSELRQFIADRQLLAREA